MEKDYKVFTIRRLFKEDIPVIESSFAEFDFLHFNPLNTDYIEKTLLSGEFWGVYHNDRVIALTYMQRADVPPFSCLNAAWEISDLLDSTLSDSFICGYVWTDTSCENSRLYSALTRLWILQAVHYDKSRLIHYMPAHMPVDLQRLFENDFQLAGLRGLDNIVPHYIFVRDAQLKKSDKEIDGDIKSCPMSDEMAISMLCEHGYKGYDIDRQKNILFRR